MAEPTNDAVLAGEDLSVEFPTDQGTVHAVRGSASASSPVRSSASSASRAPEVDHRAQRHRAGARPLLGHPERPVGAIASMPLDELYDVREADIEVPPPDSPARRRWPLRRSSRRAEPQAQSKGSPVRVVDTVLLATYLRMGGLVTLKAQPPSRAAPTRSKGADGQGSNHFGLRADGPVLGSGGRARPPREQPPGDSASRA